MKVQINSLDNGSGMIETLEVWGGYNPQNKVFNDLLCKIEQDNFINCFAEEIQDKIFEEMQGGKIVFNVPKSRLLMESKQWFAR